MKILFFILGVSWLLAPFVHDQHFGHLYLISNYEGYGQPWSWAFRISDLLASLLLIILTLYYRLWRRNRLAAGLVIGYAAFAVLDAIFPLDCRPLNVMHCVSLNDASTLAHYVESTIMPLIALFLILFDVKQRRSKISAGFALLQIGLGLLVINQVIVGQPAIMLEYLYEVALLVWLIYYVENYSGRRPVKAAALSKWYRASLALWAGLSGVLAIVIAAAHLHLYDNGFGLYFGQGLPWLAKERVFVGVLLLYLSRQVYIGQRRAAYALALLFGFEIFSYSLFEPSPVLTILYELSFVTVFISRRAFGRNTGPLNLHRRVYDLLYLLGGVAVAITVVIVILAAVGRLHYATVELDRSSDYITGIYSRHDANIDRHSRQVQQTAVLLGLTTTAVSAWALFRPASQETSSNEVDRRRAATILKGSSNSSEDYFKLWPLDKSYYFNDLGDGFIAYKLVGGTAFVLADPVAASSSSRQGLLDSFTAFCTAKGWKVCVLIVGEKTKNLYNNLSLLPIGASAVINISEFNLRTRRDKWWRWQNNRGLTNGLIYKSSLPPHSSALLQEWQNISEAWLKKAGRREQGFALGYFNADYLNNCRVHYLTDQHHKAVAFTNELPIFSGRQTTIDLLRYVPDQDGTMPFLLMSVVEQLGKENRFETFDLGFVPLAQLNSPSAQFIKTIASLRFSAAGLEQFKGKFKPVWTTNYLAYGGDILDLAALALKLETALKPDN